MNDDPAVKLFSQFLKDNNLEVKLSASYAGESSKAANAMVDKLLAENQITLSLAVSFLAESSKKEPHGKSKPTTPKTTD